MKGTPKFKPKGMSQFLDKKVVRCQEHSYTDLPPKM